jgi:hypothetical protein
VRGASPIQVQSGQRVWLNDLARDGALSDLRITMSR